MRLFYWLVSDGDAVGDGLGFHLLKIPLFTYQNPTYYAHLQQIKRRYSQRAVRCLR